MRGLDASLRLERGSLTIDARLGIEHGTVAVLGPNGAGKSTIVATLAGLVPLREGFVRVDSETWEDTTTRTRMSPQSRRVSVMFQGLHLFPWLDAADNVAYPLRRLGTSKVAARERAVSLLRVMDLGEHAHHKPIELSGGEAQRVALARALITEPKLLMLDEPLSDLDATSRSDMRHLVAEHLATFAGVAIVVTHDPLEAAALADGVVVVEGGRVTQAGSFEDLAAKPRSRYVADLRGTNFYKGRGHGSTVELRGAHVVVAEGAPPDALIAIDPRAVALHLDEPKGSPRNAWHLTISHIETLDRSARVVLTGDLDIVAEVTPESVRDLDLRSGGRVWATVKAMEISVYPA